MLKMYFECYSLILRPAHAFVFYIMRPFSLLSLDAPPTPKQVSLAESYVQPHLHHKQLLQQHHIPSVSKDI